MDDASQLPRAMVDAYTYCDDVIVEQKITGTEIAVGVIDTGDGPTALPAVEIVPRSGVYGFEARYNAGETTFFTPARLEADASSLRRSPPSPRTRPSVCGTCHASTSSSTRRGPRGSSR